MDGSRVVWAEGGKLMASRVKTSGLTGSTQLQDFNAMKFERIRAPY